MGEERQHVDEQLDDDRVSKLIRRVRPQRDRDVDEPKREGTMRPAEQRGRRSFTVTWGSDGSPRMRNG